MSTAPAATTGLHDQRFEKIVSHSTVIYWWPVWLAGFIMALITYIDNDRLIIVSDKALLQEKPTLRTEGGTGKIYKITDDQPTPVLDRAEAEFNLHPNDSPFRMRISHRSWMGPVFLFVTLLVVFITNVPLRGLWSIITIVVLVAVVIILSILHWWDEIFNNLAGLHIYMNMAGYLFLSLTLFVLWALTVFVFDERKYIIFTPGQMRVRLEIGTGEETYGTQAMVIRKQQDDLFRHRILGLWFLGIGSGDLIINTAGARSETITVPNVWRVSYRLGRGQGMQRGQAIGQG